MLGYKKRALSNVGHRVHVRRAGNHRELRSVANFSGATSQHAFTSSACPPKERKPESSRDFLYPLPSWISLGKIISASYLILHDRNFSSLWLSPNLSSLVVSLDEEFKQTCLGISDMKNTHLIISLELRGSPHKAQGPR